MKLPFHISELPAESWYAGTDREIRGRALCDVGGTARVGVGYLELAPGCHTGPAHWHSLEEEHLFVLSGHGTLHLGSESFALRAGTYVCFPAGQAVAHYLSNAGAEPLTYLMIGERIDGDVVTYPDAGSS
jgi:uncharacterized cupin superfamily protein